MREPGYTPPTATELHSQNDPSIPSKADLNTATTARGKPKRRTKKYRAIERPDGIIVEHPRYRPAGTSQKPPRRFEGNSVPSNYTATQHKPTRGARSSNIEHDLMGIGMSICVVCTDNISSDVSTRLPGGGRAGHNEEATGEHASIHVVAGRSEHQLYHRFTPMARFLGERGPWNSYSLQGGQEELWDSYTPSASAASKW